MKTTHKFLAIIFVLFSSMTANAGELPHSKIIDPSDPCPGKPIGSYACGHEYLHDQGVIDEAIKDRSLLRGQNVSCCDDIGECRLTRIRPGSDGKPEFNFEDKVWCPVHATVTESETLRIPGMAMVCATELTSVMKDGRICPSSVFCASVPAGDT